MITALEFAPVTNNQRVAGLDIPGDESPRVFSNETAYSLAEKEGIIRAAYLQIFHQQQMLQSFRQQALESQFINGQISVRDFIQGLLSSESFRRLNYDCNNNYRFTELCIERVLGRQAYGQPELLSWSIILATQGLTGFIHQLLNSDEYLENFGFETVPFHRRRVISQRAEGSLPFQRRARYAEDFKDQLPQSRAMKLIDTTGNAYRQIVILPVIAGLLLILGVFVNLL